MGNTFSLSIHPPERRLLLFYMILTSWFLSLLFRSHADDYWTLVSLSQALLYSIRNLWVRTPPHTNEWSPNYPINDCLIIDWLLLIDWLRLIDGCNTDHETLVLDIWKRIKPLCNRWALILSKKWNSKQTACFWWNPNCWSKYIW